MYHGGCGYRSSKHFLISTHISFPGRFVSFYVGVHRGWCITGKEWGLQVQEK
jgi:hypothetical protein